MADKTFDLHIDATIVAASYEQAAMVAERRSKEYLEMVVGTSGKQRVPTIEINNLRINPADRTKRT